MRDKDIYTTGQVARLCKVAPRTVSKWLDSGLMQGYRIPGSNDRRVTRSKLVDFLVKNNMPMGGLAQDVVLHGTSDKAEALTALLPEGMVARACPTVFDLARMVDQFSAVVVLDFALLPGVEREATLKSLHATSPKADVIVLYPEDCRVPADHRKTSNMAHPVSVVALAEKIRHLAARW